MFVFNKLQSYLPFNHSPQKVDLFKTELQGEFSQLLRSSDTNATAKFISEHPELINERFYDSGLTPAELSLTLKNATNLTHLIKANAHINALNKYQLSVLDQILLMKDSKLLSDVFGLGLAHIFQNTQSEFKSSKIESFLMEHAQTQISTIENEIKDFQALAKSSKLKNSLVMSIENNKQVSFDKDSYKPKDVFDALCFFIMTNQNEAIETLYTQFGDEILSSETTDFKNLYHIAAMADNAAIIEKLHNWGLESDSAITSLAPFSPTHYAVMHPTLNTFFALINAKVPIPPGAQFSQIRPDSIHLKKQVKELTFSPLQLIILKANLHDPLKDTNNFQTISIMLALAELIATKVDPHFLSYEVKVFLALYRSMFFLSEISRPFLNYQISPALLIVSIIFNLLDSNVYKPIVELPLIKFSLAAIMAKNIWHDFKGYQATYQYRPFQTAVKVIKDIAKNFLFIDTAFVDSTPLKFNPTNTNFNYNNPTYPNPNLNVTQLSDSVKAVPLETLDKCISVFKIEESKATTYCAQIIEKLNLNLKSTLNCLSKRNWIDLTSQQIDSLSIEQLKEIFKQTRFLTHPDKCNNSLELCKSIWNKLNPLYDKKFKKCSNPFN